MSLTVAVSDRYAQALALRARLGTFVVDLGERRGWKLAADILSVHFAGAFTRFLDAPSVPNLDRVLAFAADIERTDRQLADIRPSAPRS